MNTAPRFRRGAIPFPDMDNLTIIIRKDGSRELIHEGSLYSDNLALQKAILTERPKDVYGVEVWRAMRGRVKSKSFKPSKNGKELSEVIESLKLQGREATRPASIAADKEAAAELKAAKVASEKAEKEAEKSGKDAK